MRPDYNNFLVSHGDTSIILDHHTYLSDEQREEIANEWSTKLGVEIGEQLVYVDFLNEYQSGMYLSKSLAINSRN